MPKQSRPQQPFFVVERVITQYAMVHGGTLNEAYNAAKALSDEAWIKKPRSEVFLPYTSWDAAGLLQCLRPDQPHIRVKYDTNWIKGGCSCEYSPSSGGVLKETHKVVYLPFFLVDALSVEDAFILKAQMDPGHITEVDEENFYDAQGNPWPEEGQSDGHTTPAGPLLQ